MNINITTRTSAKYIPVFLLFFLLVFAGCHKTQPADADLPYQEKFNLQYGIDSLQQFNLFLPGGRNEKTKTVIVIHGGGWVSGEKEYVDYYGKRLADMGYAAVSMDYRLASDAVHYPEMLNDIDSMIGCIYKNAHQWNIGSEKIALFGYSAGGHLALLYAYSGNQEKKIGSVVSLAGPADIQDSLLWETPGILEEIALMTGYPLPVNWSNASPINFISASNPATLLIHGINDTVVPVSQSLKLKNLLNAANVKVDLLLLKDETHEYSADATRQFMDETKRFLDANLK